MPYKSRKQAAYMHIHHPDIAKKWDNEIDKMKADGSYTKPPVQRPTKRRKPKL